MPEKCTNCEKDASLICSWCKLAWYCNKKCQKADWKRQHKQICTWASDKKKARNTKKQKDEDSKPHFIQTGPNSWHHPARPTNLIERYRKMALFGTEPLTESEPLIKQSKIRNLDRFIKHNIPLRVNGCQISANTLSFKSVPSKAIEPESLPIIIRKSVKYSHSIDLSDWILTVICGYHYNYNPLSAANLIVGLLTQHQNVSFVKQFLKHAEKSQFDGDISFSRSEELFDSQKRLMMNNLEKCMDSAIFNGLRFQLEQIVNYMNANYFDCHLMTNHITNDDQYFQYFYLFIAGVDIKRESLKVIMLKIYDQEGDVW